MQSNLTACPFSSGMQRGSASQKVETYHYQPMQAQSNGKRKTLRVAAYARVSTLSENQEDSFETQCAYYERLISSNPNMTLVGVYGDQGASGLSTRGRTAFHQMMEDCKNGKIDLVMTRSVSRFSRNMTECVENVNTLKALGVAVRFEKEGLTTTDPGSEMFFHILATLAQEESGSLSRRMVWAIERRAEMGDPIRRCAYGYMKRPAAEKGEAEEGRAWVINEEEARRVRKAFEMAAELYPYDAILHQLNMIEQSAGTGVTWSQERLSRMLSSEIYIGDILTHKTYSPDYVSKKRVRNSGERTQYYITNHHEPLVSLATYERVQSLMDAGLLHSWRTCQREEHEMRVEQWHMEEAREQTCQMICQRRKKKSQHTIVQVDHAAVEGNAAVDEWNGGAV